MKKSSFLFTAILSGLMLFSPALTFADSKDVKQKLTEEEAYIADLVSTLNEVKAPFIHGDYLVFTAKNNARHIGIAFDFERYTKIHSFKIHNVYDMDFNVRDSLQFYILKLPKESRVINYRLIIDGLWTTDPTNTNKAYSEEAGVVLSQVNVTRSVPLVTEKKSDGYVHFIYKGDKGQQIRLGGDFTNWDSWIYQMTEIQPGLYECELPLPPGTYLYAYYNGMTSMVDKTNPNRCYTNDGKVASSITVR